MAALQELTRLISAGLGLPGLDGRRDERDANSTEKVIARGVVVVGDIRFSGTLLVHGEVRGNVSALDNQAATVVIGEKGRVAGEITVDHLSVRGSVAGEVCVATSVELHSKARVTCDLAYMEITMHPGAVVQGQLMHQEQSGEARDASLASLHTLPERHAKARYRQTIQVRPAA